MKILFLLLLLSVPVFAQKALEPIRVTVATYGEQSRGIDKLLRAELQKRGDVAITSKRADYEIHVAIGPMTDDGACGGYSAAMLVIGPDNKPILSAHIGRDEQRLVAHLIRKLREQVTRK